MPSWFSRTLIDATKLHSESIEFVVLLCWLQPNNLQWIFLLWSVAMFIVHFNCGDLFNIKSDLMKIICNNQQWNQNESDDYTLSFSLFFFSS